MYPVIDLHCDTIAQIESAQREGKQRSLRQNALHIDLERMRQGGYLCQCFALFTHLGALRKRGESPFAHACHLADCMDEAIAPNEDYIQKCTSYQEIAACQTAGKMAALMTVEEGGVFEGKIENLHALYRRGVRMSTLTWNFANELGYPNPNREKGKPYHEDVTNGLTPAGVEMVREMQRIGVLVDLSHLNDAGIWDVFACTKEPVIASHSNARAECGHLRNLTDAMIRKLADRGGVTGINYCSEFVRPDTDFTSCEDLVRHMRHLKQVGGIDCIALGSDYDGIGNQTEMGGAQGMQMLADFMENSGFTTGEIEKVFSQNALRVLKDVL